MVDAIRIRGLVKEYPGTTAVAGLDLTVPQGSFFGLLGPNGAGKTTTIGTLSGLVRPTAGTVEIFGHDAASAEARRDVGLCGQEPNFDDFLGLERILAYHAGYFGMPFDKALKRARELLDFFELGEYRNRRTSTLSGGMKRRLLLARALMHEPKLLILDEPTAGVDVELRRSLWKYIRKLNEDGMTILLTTHYLEEAEALCDEVVVINQGRVIESGTPDALRDKYGSRKVRVRTNVTIDAADLGFSYDGRRWIREDQKATEALPALLARIEAAGGVVEDLEVDRSKLEDVFVTLTKEAE